MDKAKGADELYYKMVLAYFLRDIGIKNAHVAAVYYFNAHAKAVVDTVIL